MDVLTNTEMLLFVAGALAGGATCLLVLAGLDQMAVFRELRRLNRLRRTGSGSTLLR